MTTDVALMSRRFVVATHLAGEWLPRAVLSQAEEAEREAFRWRRIYGRQATQVLEIWVEDEKHIAATPVAIDQAISVAEPYRRRSVGRRVRDRRQWLKLRVTQRLLDLMMLYIMGEMALRMVHGSPPIAF